jgi:hypothetical protein
LELTTPFCSRAATRGRRAAKPRRTNSLSTRRHTRKGNLLILLILRSWLAALDDSAIG